jgi:hypothetical protein
LAGAAVTEQLHDRFLYAFIANALTGTSSREVHGSPLTCLPK